MEQRPNTLEDSPYSLYKSKSVYQAYYNCQRKDWYDKMNGLSNCKCSLAPHINKISCNAIELGSINPFQDLEFHARQQW